MEKKKKIEMSIRVFLFDDVDDNMEAFVAISIS